MHAAIADVVGARDLPAGAQLDDFFANGRTVSREDPHSIRYANWLAVRGGRTAAHTVLIGQGFFAVVPGADDGHRPQPAGASSLRPASQTTGFPTAERARRRASAPVPRMAADLGRRGQILGDAVTRLPADQPRPPALSRTAERGGRVEEVHEDHFAAIVTEFLPPYSARRIEFPLEHLAPHNRQLLAPGTTFTWILGWRTEVDGTRAAVSIIAIRQTPRPLNPDQHRYADEQARQMLHALGVRETGRRSE